MSEDKQSETAPALGQRQEPLSYMNQVAENGKVRPLPTELIRKTWLGAEQPPCRPIQEEILEWDAIRAASAEPEASKGT